MYICIYVYMCICIHVFYVYMCICVYLYMCICLYVYIVSVRVSACPPASLSACPPVWLNGRRLGERRLTDGACIYVYNICPSVRGASTSVYMFLYVYQARSVE